MNDQTTEQAIQAAGANVAPRITPADIEANIVAEHYFTARDGCEGACGGGGTYHVSLGLLTFCVLVLRNGFTVTGESACASPENFNADIGRRIARENAVANIWPLMGYELRTRIASGDTTIADRTVRMPAAPKAYTWADVASYDFREDIMTNVVQFQIHTKDGKEHDASVAWHLCSSVEQAIPHLLASMNSTAS